MGDIKEMITKDRKSLLHVFWIYYLGYDFLNLLLPIIITYIPSGSWFPISYGYPRAPVNSSEYNNLYHHKESGPSYEEIYTIPSLHLRLQQIQTDTMRRD